MSHAKNYEYLLDEFNYNETLKTAMGTAKTEAKQMDASANKAGDAIIKRKQVIVSDILYEIDTNHTAGNLKSESSLIPSIREAYDKLFLLFNAPNLEFNKPVYVNGSIGIMGIYAQDKEISFITNDMKAHGFNAIPISLHKKIFESMNKAPNAI